MCSVCRMSVRARVRETCYMHSLHAISIKKKIHKLILHNTTYLLRWPREQFIKRHNGLAMLNPHRHQLLQRT